MSSTIQDEHLHGLLRRHGITPTRPRLLIARLLLSAPLHRSAEQVIDGLAGSATPVSKATVYNTLGLFARRGLLREVVVGRGRVFYDSNVGAHHHLYDVDTGELVDIPPESIAVGPPQALPEGVRVEGMDVVVRIRRDAGEG